MAEALAVIGLVGNIVAFVEFSQKVVTRLDEFSNNLKYSTKSLKQIQTELPLIIDAIQRIKDRADSGKLDDNAKTSLGPVVLECQQQAQRLSDILDNILPASDSSTWERRKKAILSLKTDRKVEEISKALGRYVQTLTFYHVIDGARPDPVVENTFWLIPFDRNPMFVGRDVVFEKIHEAFNVREGSQPKTALYGLGGIGKSQIALEYCFRKLQENPACSVFWVNAATAARFEESFQRIARACLLGHEEGQDDSITLVQRWLEAEYVSPWIMVIDNVDDETAFLHDKCRNNRTPYQCLPRCSHGKLLFTSRTRDVAVDLASPLMPINVASMTTEEGLELMRKRLGPDPPEGHLIELLSELEHIPLAVTQSMSFILKRRKSVQQYLDLYRMGDHSRNRLLSYEFLDHGRQQQTMDSVARTLTLSFDWIRNHHPKSAEIMCLMSFYQHHGVPAQLLRLDDDMDLFEFEDSIAVLQAFSLLEVNESGTMYSTHRLIQMTAKWWLDQEDPAQLEKRALQALEIITRRFPPPSRETTGDYWEHCQSLLPHAEVLLHQKFKMSKRESDLTRARLLICTGKYLGWLLVGDWRDVQRRFQESFDIRQSYLGPKHFDTLKAMGFVFWSGSRGSCSLFDVDGKGLMKLGYELLELRREVLGSRHPDTIDALSDVAGLLESLGNLEESETMQREALTISEEVNGPTHHETTNCRTHLASVLDSMGKHAESVETGTQAVMMFTKMLGPEHRSVLVSRSDLALYLSHSGRFDESCREHKEVITLKEKVYGVENPETLITVRNLAALLAQRERYNEAVDVLAHAMSLFRAGWRNRVASVDYGSPQAIESLKLRYELVARESDVGAIT